MTRRIPPHLRENFYLYLWVLRELHRANKSAERNTIAEVMNSGVKVVIE